MIPTHPNFGAKNQELAKRPLYIVTIDGILEPLTSFRIEDMDIVWGGYGVAGYGTAGYGF